MFTSEYIVKEALFVDSKAEKSTNSITLQISQTSLTVKQIRGGNQVEFRGHIPLVYEKEFLPVTVFVKYHYSEINGLRTLQSIKIVSVPHGFLQGQYCADHLQSIWLVGRNAQSLGEEFRVRVSLNKLKALCAWRVQEITSQSSPWSQ